MIVVVVRPLNGVLHHHINCSAPPGERQSPRSYKLPGQTVNTANSARTMSGALASRTLDIAATVRLQHSADLHVHGGQGKIVNTASLLSFQGGVNVPGYTASKSAVAGLTKALANEWAPLGVNVNAVAPGYVATANTYDLRQDAARNQAILGQIPAGRWAEASDIAGAVLFLCSHAPDYIHGIILPVDGGWLAR